MKKSKISLFACFILLLVGTTSCNTLCGFFNLSCGKNKGDFYIAEASGDTYNEFSNYNLYGIHYPNSVGNLNILVIPVTIKGYESNATEDNRERIYEAFFGNSDTTGWESVSSYYYKSSYGKLNISGVVTDWYECEKTTTELYNATTDAGMGSLSLLSNAVSWAKETYPTLDFSLFDCDYVGLFDAVMLIYSAPNYTNWDSYLKAVANETTNLFELEHPESNLFWAFTYWDQYASGTHNNPAPHGYSFMSYDFMDESILDDDPTNDIAIDAHTYIHEFGHILGLDDYYDYDGMHSPLCGVDMMDLNVGDHNAFTKYALGWTTPYVVNSDCTITIGPEATTGDAIIVTSSSKTFPDTAFAEYFILELVTPDELWEWDATHTYSNNVLAYTQPGVRIMHVDARLVYYSTGNFCTHMEYTYATNQGLLDQYASNTPSYGYDYYNGKYSAGSLKTDFISMIPATNSFNEFQTTNMYYASYQQLFTRGDSFSASRYSKFFNNGRMHDGSSFDYQISIDSCSSSSATISFKVI